jgi:hypothetical protein
VENEVLLEGEGVAEIARDLAGFQLDGDDRLLLLAGEHDLAQDFV